MAHKQDRSFQHRKALWAVHRIFRQRKKGLSFRSGSPADWDGLCKPDSNLFSKVEGAQKDACREKEDRQILSVLRGTFGPHDRLRKYGTSSYKFLIFKENYKSCVTGRKNKTVLLIQHSTQTIKSTFKLKKKAFFMKTPIKKETTYFVLLYCSLPKGSYRPIPEAEGDQKFV